MAITFASGDYVEAQKTSGNEWPTVGSVAFRFRTTQTTANVSPLSAHGGSASNAGYTWLLNNTANKLTFYAKVNSGTTAWQINGTTTINDGNWHTAVGVYSTLGSAAISFYVDGALEGSATSHATSFVFVDTRCRLARSVDTFWGAFVGELAEVAWFNVHLSADDAAAYHKGFSPKIIKPGKMALYIPGVRSGRAVTELASTTTSGTSVSDHPRRIY